MDVENIEEFKRVFELAVRSQETTQPSVPILNYFSELSLADITPGFWKELMAFAPFGPYNRNPVFVSRNVQDIGYSQLLKDKHLRLHISQNGSAPIKAIAFNQGVHFSKIKSEPFHICYTIQENHWNGRTTLQLNVKDIKFEEE